MQRRERFQVYRTAAKRVRSGWVQGVYRDAGGRVCLVQGVLESADLARGSLPLDMAEELNAQLEQYASYRILRRIALLHHVDRRTALQAAIMGWNDMFRRRQGTVVQTLDGLADRLELEWLRDEYARLTVKVKQLEGDKLKLQARVDSLEAENLSLRRQLVNFFGLRARRRELEQLDRELDAVWQELKALPELPA